MSKDKLVPHIHAEVIKQWAMGEEVQTYDCGAWVNIASPVWSTKHQYRVKPKPPKVIELYANADFFGGQDKGDCISPEELIGNFTSRFISTDNLKLSFCPLTGILIAAEVVKHEKAGDNE